MKKLILLLLLTPALAAACDKGCEKFKDTCVCQDATPYFGTPVQPSDEKVPDDKMPSYQREGMVLATVENTMTRDENADKAKAQADRDGKHAAGIPGY